MSQPHEWLHGLASLEVLARFSWLIVINIWLTGSHSCWYLDMDITFFFLFFLARLRVDRGAERLARGGGCKQVKDTTIQVQEPLLRAPGSSAHIKVLSAILWTHAFYLQAQYESGHCKEEDEEDGDANWCMPSNGGWLGIQTTSHEHIVPTSRYVR